MGKLTRKEVVEYSLETPVPHAELLDVIEQGKQETSGEVFIDTDGTDIVLRFVTTRHIDRQELAPTTLRAPATPETVTPAPEPVVETTAEVPEDVTEYVPDFSDVVDDEPNPFDDDEDDVATEPTKRPIETSVEDDLRNILGEEEPERPRPAPVVDEYADDDDGIFVAPIAKKGNGPNDGEPKVRVGIVERGEEPQSEGLLPPSTVQGDPEDDEIPDFGNVDNEEEGGVPDFSVNAKGPDPDEYDDEDDDDFVFTAKAPESAGQQPAPAPVQVQVPERVVTEPEVLEDDLEDDDESDDHEDFSNAFDDLAALEQEIRQNTQDDDEEDETDSHIVHRKPAWTKAYDGNS